MNLHPKMAFARLVLAASALVMIAGCAQRRPYYAPVGYAPPVVVVHHYGPGYGGGYGYGGGPTVVHVHHYGSGYGGYGGGYGRGPIVVHHYHHY